MDIHRCRFVPLPPSSINALAFSHSYISKDQVTAPPRLAVGRANGDIEIWNPLRGCWLQEMIIRGGKDRSIDGLVWIQDPNDQIHGKTIIGRSRLFSIGYTTTITEWDLKTGQPLRQASGNHGEIWCIASQPSIPSLSKPISGRSDSPDYNRYLIAGCTDGALALYSTQDNDLQLQKLLVRPSSKKAKIISVTFQDRNIVVAGCTDSTIRIFDIRNGALLRSMTLGSGLKGGPKDIIVWATKVLRDGTIISGDSTGELKIWDGKTYTLRQRILAHRQDILCLTTNISGTAIFSGGMDQRTVLYKPVAKFKGRWTEVAHRRFHDHDVKAMASFEGHGMSVFVSGGHDASPIVVPIGKYGFEHQRALPYLSQNPAIRSASRARLLVSWWEREVWIWKMEKFVSPIENDFTDESPRGRQLVAKIYIKGEANIVSAAIDLEGKILVVGTIAEIKAFHLRPCSNSKGTRLQISTLKLPSTLSCGAKLLNFSPNGKWLCIVQPENQIILARFIYTTSPPKILPIFSKLSRIDRQIDKLISLGGLGSYPRVITQVAFSAASNILALSDLAGYIDSFVLNGKENSSLDEPTKDASDSAKGVDSESDSDDEIQQRSNLIFGQCWIRNPMASSIPQLSTTPVALSFRPSDVLKTKEDDFSLVGLLEESNHSSSQPVKYEDRLLVITAKSEVFEFEILKGRLSDWSRRNPPAKFPKRYKMTLETVRGVFWDLSNGNERVWLYSIGWLWMFDLKRDFSEERKIEQNTKLKRKRGSCGAGNAIKNSELIFAIEDNSKKIPEEISSEEKKAFGKDDNMNIIDNEDKHPQNHPPFPHILLSSNMESKENEAISDISPSSYHTFKYRPIVGVVTLENENVSNSLEVVIVERPIWEAELPPRYYGEQEWRSQEIDG